MPTPTPAYPASNLIVGVEAHTRRIHKADGDMWPLTWAADGNMYGGAGDNMGSPMNIWRIVGSPEPYHSWGMHLEQVHPMPVDPRIYCTGPDIDTDRGVKPASLLSLNGVLYLAAELHNYGIDPSFNRQNNISSFIATSTDKGITWNLDATKQGFLTGRLASPHFLQFGQDYAGARDNYVYAYFPAGDDGRSYWCNGDHLLLGRVPKGKLLVREQWEFICGFEYDGAPIWNEDGEKAVPIFEYPRMTGEDHVSYCPALRRYILGNFSFMDTEGNPRPYHQSWPESVAPSQLTLFEAPEPWGPWHIFHRDDDWGTYGDYQPVFPTKWMADDGTYLWMVSSGSYDDYNFTAQKLGLTVLGARRCFKTYIET